jgi:hypothetical protein
MLVKPYIFFKTNSHVNNAPGTFATFIDRKSLSEGDTKTTRKKEHDEQFMHSMAVVREIHGRIFADGITDSNTSSVVRQFIDMKQAVLRGFIIAFSVNQTLPDPDTTQNLYRTCQNLTQT